MFRHGFRNEVHAVREATEGNFVIVSFMAQVAVAIRVNGARVNTTRAHVSITLYGRGWSEKDVQRAERNSRFLSPDTTPDQGRAVRDAILASSHTWLSLPLK